MYCGKHGLDEAPHFSQRQHRPLRYVDSIEGQEVRGGDVVLLK